jgi:uncharacterized oxidoreductase
MDLHDRRILITGGTSGIGLELAKLLANDNHVVVGARDITTHQREGTGSGLHAVMLDVTSEVDSRAALAEAVDHLGGLDMLVNSAGILRRIAQSEATAAAAVEAEVAVNLVGSMRMTRLALPSLEHADDGAVVFLSSALALTAAPGLASYAATKSGVHSFARSLRAELAGRVRVFDVLPPFVDTALAAGFAGPKLSPEVVAAAIVEGLRRDRYEIRIGRANALSWMARLWPAAADRIIARELGRAAAVVEAVGAES